MTGQHWKELARSVCKTRALGIGELCAILRITPQQYHMYEREGMGDRQRVLLMGRIRKFLVA